jgi:hypothetical protein
VLYVLRFLAFDYPFGIFKLFFLNTIVLWITVGQYLYILLTDTVLLSLANIYLFYLGHRGRDRMVVRFTTTRVTGACHH